MLVLFLAPVINTETVFWVTYVQWSWEEFISQYPIKVNVYPYTKELLNTYVSTNIYTYWIHKSSFNQMMVQEKINFSTRLAISRNTIWHKYLFRIKAKKDKNVDHKVEDSFFLVNMDFKVSLLVVCPRRRADSCICVPRALPDCWL